MMRRLTSLTAALSGAALLLLVLAPAATTVGAEAQVNDGVIQGQVTSTAGPEAGVWVIAETDDLETVFRKIVVTDDDGRYLLPELPVATYDVWVRGYGLVDSEPVEGRPGDELTLTAVVASTPVEAAQVYPSTYWLSLINLPEAHEFPGSGPDGNGIGETMETQAHWINNLKGCQRCHQVGSERTREIPDLTNFDSARARLERPDTAGAARHADVQLYHALRPGTRARHAGRLDGPDRRRRGARSTASPAGDRAECRHHDVELGRQRRVRP